MSNKFTWKLCSDINEINLEHADYQCFQMHSTQWSELAACLIPHRWEDLRSAGKGFRIKQFKYFHLIVSKLKAETGEAAHPGHTTGKKINCSEINALLSGLGLGFPNSQVSLITTTTHMTCV